MERIKWTEREFVFDFPEGQLPDILERLRGTSLRIRDLIKDLSDAELKRKPKGKWSIKENIGHLGDLEELHDYRVDDFMQHKKSLLPADLSNTKTQTANHNDRDIKDLLKEFERKRTILIRRLELLDDETQKTKSLHPRLNKMIRPVDLAYFVAEHDDHHLETIRELKESTVTA